MTYDERKLCVVCAWRGTCQLKYSMPGGVALHCAEFTRDVTLKEPVEEIRKRNILLVGPREIGKTTLVRKVVDQSGRQVEGYYTRSGKKGWLGPPFQELAFLSGDTRTLAKCKAQKEWVRMGKWYVDLNMIEQHLVPLLRNAMQPKKTDLIVLDEVGKFHCISEAFRKQVVDCITSSKSVLATVSVGDQDEDFLSVLESRSDVSTYHVGYENRDQLVQQLAFSLTGRQEPHKSESRILKENDASRS